MFRDILLSLVLLTGFVSSAHATVSPTEKQEAMLEDIEARTFAWFWDSANPKNGLIPDRTPEKTFASIAGVGFGLTAIPIGIERGYVTRSQGIERVLTTMRFLRDAPQARTMEGATGYRGFYYHFLHMGSGKRYKDVELSTIDTAICMMGVLFCESYFDGETPEEVEIRRLAEELYGRVEWTWFLVRPNLLCMGWKPESGAIDADYKGYDEAMLLYLLAMGSTTHPIPPAAWQDFTKTERWADFKGQEHIIFAPLFGHQYSHAWIDFRGIQDAVTQDRNIDYFENSRRAVLGQRAYAIENPMGWKDYGPNIWGLTACDGPRKVTRKYNGEKRQFFTYSARGADADYIHDDGTVAPTAAVASLPFAPEVVLPTIEEMLTRYGENVFNKHGFVDAFNPSYDFRDRKIERGTIVPGLGWFDSDQLGIDQGPILLMIENYRTGFVWDIMKRNPHLIIGLKRAGFSGGWLDELLKQVSKNAPQK